VRRDAGTGLELRSSIQQTLNLTFDRRFVCSRPLCSPKSKKLLNPPLERKIKVIGELVKHIPAYIHIYIYIHTCMTLTLADYTLPFC
jgi:hypothetical protein